MSHNYQGARLHWTTVILILAITIGGFSFVEMKSQNTRKQALSVKVANDFYRINFYGQKTNTLAGVQDAYECELAGQTYQPGKPCNTDPATDKVKQHFSKSFFTSKVTNYHQYLASRLQSVEDLNALVPYENAQFAKQVQQYGDWLILKEQSNFILTVGRHDKWQSAFANTLGFSLTLLP